MDLGNKIQFVGIINDRGRLVVSSVRKGIEPLQSSKDSEIMFMEVALRVKMRKEFDKQLGPVKFAMAYREKSTVMSFPIDDCNTLYLLGEPNLDFKDVALKILKILHQVRQVIT